MIQSQSLTAKPLTAAITGLRSELKPSLRFCRNLFIYALMNVRSLSSLISAPAVNRKKLDSQPSSNFRHHFCFHLFVRITHHKRPSRVRLKLSLQYRMLRQKFSERGVTLLSALPIMHSMRSAYLVWLCQCFLSCLWGQMTSLREDT